MCIKSGLAATRWCPDITLVDEEPSLGCRKHKPPRPLPNIDFILFILDAAVRIDHTDEEVGEFAERIGKAGVDYVRIFPGWEEIAGVRRAPFLHSDGAGSPFDCYQIDPIWMSLIQRFQKALAKEGVGIMFDLFPAQLCRKDYTWAWWHENGNVNNLDGVYDTRPHAMIYWKWWIAKVAEIIGKEGNIFMLGNELQGPGDGGSNETSDVAVLKEWARKWAVPLCTYMRDDLKLAMPISMCGEPYRGTGHKISNRLIEEEGWPEKDLLIHLHGVNLWEPFNLWYKPGTAERKYSVRKFYCISDDGSEFGPDNKIPPEKKGICSTRLDGSIKCSANQQWRTDTIKRIKAVSDFQLCGIEWMPQSCKGDPRLWRLSNLDQEVEIDVYWKAAMEIWGVDIRRS